MRSKAGKILEQQVQTRTDKILKLLMPQYFRKRVAHQVFSHLSKTELPVFHHQLEIGPYQGKNATVKSISDYLQSRSHPAITAAILHGSIASGEEVPYSDFDGILLINDKRLENLYSIESLIDILQRTEFMMLQQDALQHHGWNVIMESELANYPDSELPLVLLENSKVIYPSRKISIYYNLYEQECDYRKCLLELCSSLTSKAESNSPSRSFHHFKSWVSQLLLLPAVYLQAKNNKPVYKKDSFARLHELPSSATTIMRQYSQLRSQWNQEEAIVNREMNFRKWNAAGKIADQLATPVPERYKTWLTESKLEEVKKVTAQLIQSL
jgi:hypothetical protein